MSFMLELEKRSIGMLYHDISSVLIGRFSDDDEVRFVLDQQASLDFNSASSLKQQFLDRHVAPLGNIIVIPSQPVFALSR
jgi:hypothetical protein